MKILVEKSNFSYWFSVDAGPWLKPRLRSQIAATKVGIKKAPDCFQLEAVFIEMVGVAGFELATPCTPCKCATRLRYTPTSFEL
jgi:hypothetical protein